MKYHLETFQNGLEELQIKLSEEQMDQFLIFYEMLVEKNKVMNLTAITEFDEVVVKHFLDSLSLCKIVDLTEEKEILDLGTGAGFPGIPLKIAFPDLKITLLDSLQKRILFLNETIHSLSLDHIQAIHGRAEEIARNISHREYYDLCISRAVANITTLSEYCLPFVKVGGRFISYKSSEIEEELQAGKRGIFLLGGEVTEVYHFTLPESDLKRSFVMIDKRKRTPKAYPRKAGTPSKSPLGQSEVSRE